LVVATVLPSVGCSLFQEKSEDTTAPIIHDVPEQEYVIVTQSHDATTLRVKDVTSDLQELLSQKLKAKVSVITDQEPYAPMENQVWIIVGETTYALTQKAKEQCKTDTISYVAEGNSIAIYAQSQQLLTIGLDRYVNDCLKNGRLIPTKEYQSAAVNVSELLRSGWKMAFPAYEGGKLDTTLYSGGYGLSRTVLNCTMQVVTETTAEEYYAYIERLIENGYEMEFHNEIDGNLFASCRSTLGTNAYVYYMKSINKVRIIHDVVSPSLDSFCYTTETSEYTAFYQFRHTSCEREDTYLIHAADNSWIIVDGGTEDETLADDMYEFMRSRSGLNDDEKLVISAWYNTHSHRDHFAVMTPFINRYHDQIDLQRIIANIPDTAVVGNSNDADYQRCLRALQQHFPNVMWLKVHTGMKIQLADITFDVLYASDDKVEDWTKPATDPDVGWTNFNFSSTVSKITVGGFTVLETGDNFALSVLIEPFYKIDTYVSDVVKMAHHGINTPPNDFYTLLHETGKVQYWSCPTLVDTDGSKYDVASLVGDRLIKGDPSYATKYQLDSNGLVSAEKILIRENQQ
jgi:hypothetical protein